MARGAHAARLMIFPRRFAQQSLRHKPRKRCLAGIFLAGKQPSVRTVFPMTGKLPPLVLMPRINHIRKYKRLNKSVIIQGNVGGRLKLRIQFETFITSFLSSFRLFSAFLTLPSPQKVPCPYSPSVIYRNGCQRVIWRGRSRHSAPARQSFPIASLLTFLLCTLRQYCSLLHFQTTFPHRSPHAS